MIKAELGLDRTWVNIDLDALNHNIQQLRAFIKSTTQIMAVVKADAYGHGAIEIAKEMEAAGIERLAVSTVDEGILLRKDGIKIPILILSYPQKNRLSEVLEYDLTLSVGDLATLEEIARLAILNKKIAKVHIKLDTGMGRIGLPIDDNTVLLIKEMMQVKNIFIEGIFTHFADADNQNSCFTVEQFTKFQLIIKSLSKEGINFPLSHCCNSAASIAYPEYHLNCIRPGLILYGYNPFSADSPHYQTAQNLNLRPVMKMYSRIIQSKQVEQDQLLGYSRKGSVGKNEWLVTVPVGYADGLPRNLSGKIKMRIGKQLWQQTGNICMDTCMLKFNPILLNTQKGKNAVAVLPQVGEIVCLFGENWQDIDGYAGVNENALLDWSILNNTIIYELLCNIGERVPRIYVSQKKIQKTKEYFLKEKSCQV